MNVVIYRACDRPAYTEKTFPRLVEATSPEATIVMMENSGDSGNRQRNRETFDKYADGRCEILVAGRRLGVTKPLINGIAHFVQKHGKPQHVFNVDDDIMVPEPKELTWNELLSTMLEDTWDFAGIFRHVRVIGEPEGKGFASGFRGSIMAAGCAGFRYSIYEKDPLPNGGLAAFNIWSSKYRCGWSTQRDYLYEEIDKYAPEGESLRYTEYREYSEHIDKQRDKLRGKR